MAGPTNFICGRRPTALLESPDREVVCRGVGFLGEVASSRRRCMIAASIESSTMYVYTISVILEILDRYIGIFLNKIFLSKFLSSF